MSNFKAQAQEWEGLQFHEQPRATWKDRVRVGALNFTMGLVAGGGMIVLAGVMNKSPVNRQLLIQARNSGLLLGTIFGVGGQIQLSR